MYDPLHTHSHVWSLIHIVICTLLSIHILLGMVPHTYPHMHYPLYMTLDAYSLYTLICPLPYIFLFNTLSYTIHIYTPCTYIYMYTLLYIIQCMFILLITVLRQTPTELNRPYGRKVIPGNQEINLSQVGNPVSMAPTAGTLDFLTLRFLSKAS